MGPRQYAFDIHANSFFPLFLNLYVLQLILAPLVLRHNWVSLWIGNSLYLIAVKSSANSPTQPCFPSYFFRREREIHMVDVNAIPSFLFLL
jgi:hypothetical protein